MNPNYNPTLFVALIIVSPVILMTVYEIVNVAIRFVRRCAAWGAERSEP